MKAAKDESFEELHSLQRSTILRVYNYYRILLSFLFLWLFLDQEWEFVGATNPELFQDTILIYLFLNILIGLTPLIFRNVLFSRPAPSFVILTADIIGLTLLMFASGGVSSGLANFLIFTVAFGGGLIHGRISTVLPAIAFILTLYSESYLFFLDQLDQNEEQAFFQTGILGIVYFAANILFQSIAQQLHKRETEVFTLEEINKLIVEQMRTGVAVVSKAGEIKLINKAGGLLLFPTGDGKSQPEQLPQVLTELIEPHEGVASFQIDPNEPALMASFSTVATPIPDAEKLIFLEDSTEIHRQAQQLKLAALGRLSASIAHEIRNPLGAISHAAQLLSESENLDLGDRRLSEIIQTHCIRMNNVIENVLQMSRRRNADPRDLNLSNWLDSFLNEFSAGISSPIDVEVNTSDIENTTTISFDPLHLSQILGNLCQNGLRYSEKTIGKPKLTIRAGAEKGSTFLDVIDYGVGVPEDLVSNLFEPFYTTETSGTGLGLYLSKELCEANKAYLNYSNTADKGSCFRVTFIQPTRL